MVGYPGLRDNGPLVLGDLFQSEPPSLFQHVDGLGNTPGAGRVPFGHLDPDQVLLLVSTG